MKKLYLTNWNYNAALIMEELKKIIENNNGIVSTPGERCEMVNRSLNDAIRETEERINKLTSIAMENEKRTTHINELKKNLARYKLINNDPVISSFADWHYIKFKIDNVYYYLQFDSNPFFPFYFNKIKLDNNSYSGDYCMEELKKEDWLFDCFFKAGAAHEDIKEAANIIYNNLMMAPCSVQYKEKKRVYNLYDGGYHYEWIATNKNRKTTINF